MKQIYEVLFRGDANGKIVGRHVIYWENGNPGAPQTIKPEDLAAIESQINSAVLSENEGLQATVNKLQGDLADAQRPVVITGA